MYFKTTHAERIFVGVADLSAIFVPCNLRDWLATAVTPDVDIISVHRGLCVLRDQRAQFESTDVCFNLPGSFCQYETVVIYM